MNPMAPLNLPLGIPEGAATLALLERIAKALEETGKKSEEASQKTASSWEHARERIRAAADTFNEARSAVSGLAEMVGAAAERLVESASGAERLDRAQHQLGLSFEQAADAAGGYVDQVQVATAAQSLAERGIRLHQNELNALTRVAQNYARTTGKEFSEAMEQVTEVVTEGGEEMGKLDTALLRVADTAQFTANDRLRALVDRANQIAPAARTAAEEMRAFQGAMEEADRAFSHGFIESLATFRTGTEDAATKVRELRDEIHAAGAATGEVVARIGAGVVVLVGGLISGIGSVLGLLSAAGAGMEALVSRRPVGAAAAAEYRAVMTTGFMGEVTSAVASQLQVLTRDFAGGQRSSAAPVGVGGSVADRRRDTLARGPDMSFTPEQAAETDMTFTLAEAQGSNRRGGGSSRPAPEGPRIGGAASAILDRLIAEAQERQAQERAADAARETGNAGLRNAAQQEREQAQARERAQADALLAREQAEEQRVKDREREQSDAAKRLEALHSFNEQWRRLHSEQVNVAQSAAQSLNTVFGSVGAAMAKHFEALVAEQETVGQALQGVLKDVLDAFAKESYAKGGFYFAEGLGRLVAYDFPGAATSFGASVAYFSAGAVMQKLGAEIPASSPPSAGAGAGAAPAPRAAESFGRPSNDNSQGGQTVVNHYYAPVIGGRDALDSEVGQRMGRYSDAAGTRQTRDRRAA